MEEITRRLDELMGREEYDAAQALLLREQDAARREDRRTERTCAPETSSS